MISHKELIRILLYDPDSGVFTWRISGKKAGYSQRGYVVIGIGGRPYRANRLAWFYVTGVWPSYHVDHKNRVLDDNRWSNLREVTRAQNRANSKSSNSNGFKGICKHRRRWKAQIRANKKLIHIGIFKTPKEAHAAYMAKARELFGEFACSG